MVVEAEGPTSPRMREADQKPFEATQVEGELTHHTYTHFQLVDISLEAIDKFMRMMGTFGWTARSGVSTMPATFAYRSACEEYSLTPTIDFLSVAHPPLYLSRKNASFQAGFGPIHTLLDIYPVYWDAIVTGCQVKKFMHLSFVAEIWGTCGVE